MISTDKINWIDTIPITGPPLYPVLLDILESIKKYRSEKFLHSIFQLAMPHETIATAKLPGIHNTEITYEFLENYIIDNNRKSIRSTLARIAYEVSLLGDKFGIIFRNIENYDRLSRIFVDILTSRSDKNGLRIAYIVNNKIKLMNESSASPELSQLLTTKIRHINKSQYHENFLQAVATCPQGIPAHVLEKLVNYYDDNLLCNRIGPTGEKWFFLEDRTRSLIYKQIPNYKHAELHSKIFESWKASGWGYLRRGYHAALAGNLQRIRQVHIEYVNGMKKLGKGLLYTFFVKLLNNSNGLDKNSKIFLLVSAARAALETNLKRSGGLSSSIIYFRLAIKNCNTPYPKAYLMCELALLYARQRNYHALKKSRKWFARAVSVMNGIKDRNKLAYIQILILNTIKRCLGPYVHFHTERW